MPPRYVRKLVMYAGALLTIALYCECQEVDVLKITNLTFPRSDFWKPAGQTRIAYHSSVSEYTICYRHLIESFNDGLYCPIMLGTWAYAQRIFPPGEGGANGYTGTIINTSRYEIGGGIGNNSMPRGHWPFLPMDIDISKWYHICISYSSILHHVHMSMKKYLRDLVSMVH